jgi:hypothetical protein
VRQDGAREEAARPAPEGAGDLARQRARAAGFFVDAYGRSEMANHLTPDELSKEVGIDRDEVIRICVEEHVPIYHGKIDKFLFQAQLEALGALPAQH